MKKSSSKRKVERVMSARRGQTGSASIDLSQAKKDDIDSPSSPSKKVPILLREPGATFQDEFDSDDEAEDEELRVSQLVFSQNHGV